MDGDAELLFVYGTLRRNPGGAMHARLAASADYAGAGTIAGRLYDAGDYPAAVPAVGEVARVRGELYRLPRSGAGDVFVWLDVYEGYDPGNAAGSLFRRAPADILRDDGVRVRAWVYFYNRSPVGLRRIESGDYPAYLAARE